MGCINKETTDQKPVQILKSLSSTAAVQSLSHVLLFAIAWTTAQQAPLSVTIFWSLLRLSSVQTLSCVLLFVTPWTAAHQASPSITNSWSLSIELVIPSNQLILCRPLLLLPSIFPSIRVFSNESVLRMRWPQY